MPSSKKPGKQGTPALPSEHTHPRFRLGRGTWGCKTSPTAELTKLSEPGTYLAMTSEERMQMEVLYSMPLNIAVAKRWQYSEAYWLQKDNEMLSYLQDWPISKWLIDPIDAQAAYKSLQARCGLREQGQSIYLQGVPAWWPFGEDYDLPRITDPVQLDPPSKYDIPSFAAVNPVPQPTKIKPPRIQLVHKAPRPKQATAAKTQSKASKLEEPDDQEAGEARPSRYASRRSIPVDGTDSAQPTPITDVFGTGDGYHAVAIEAPSKKRRAISQRLSGDGAGGPPKKKSKNKKPIMLDEPAVTPPPYESDGVIMKPGGDFPWQATHAGDSPEEWDDSIYEPARLLHLQQIQRRNARIVSKYMEDSKRSASSRKSAAEAAFKVVDVGDLGPPPEQAPAEKVTGSRFRVRKARQIDHSNHFSGSLVFADEASLKRFGALKLKGIEQVVEAAMLSPNDERYMAIEVAHDPGEGSLIADLELPRITIMDIARTRLQYFHTKILTDRGAERIIDFCPDLLTGFTLLQIASETKYSNTSIQTRLGSNGTMMSDSTITKRVSAVLNRDFDKVGSKAAEEKNAGYKKINRQAYDKYKNWRSAQRKLHPPLPSTFDLIDAAEQRRVAKESPVEQSTTTSVHSSGDSVTSAPSSALTETTEMDPVSTVAVKDTTELDNFSEPSVEGLGRMSRDEILEKAMTLFEGRSMGENATPQILRRIRPLITRLHVLGRGLLEGVEAERGGHSQLLEDQLRTRLEQQEEEGIRSGGFSRDPWRNIMSGAGWLSDTAARADTTEVKLEPGLSEKRLDVNQRGSKRRRQPVMHDEDHPLLDEIAEQAINVMEEETPNKTRRIRKSRGKEDLAV